MHLCELTKHGFKTVRSVLLTCKGRQQARCHLSYSSRVFRSNGYCSFLHAGQLNAFFRMVHGHEILVHFYLKKEKNVKEMFAVFEVLITSDFGRDI